MKLTHREIRGIIFLLVLVTAVTALSTCDRGGSQLPAVSGYGDTAADLFVRDSLRLAERVADSDRKDAQANTASGSDGPVRGRKQYGARDAQSDRRERDTARGKRKRAADPVTDRNSPLDEPVAN